MNSLKYAVREIVGLFIDDGSLALAIIAVIGASAIIAALVPDLAIVAGAVLLVGCLAVLFGNALTSGRR